MNIKQLIERMGSREKAEELHSLLTQLSGRFGDDFGEIGERAYALADELDTILHDDENS
jgi:hypothetical protein